MGPSRLRPLILAGLLLGCEEATDRLGGEGGPDVRTDPLDAADVGRPDGPVACGSVYWVSDDAGVTTIRSGACAVGAVCGLGYGYGRCPTDGGAQATPFPVEPRIPPGALVERYQRSNPSYPACARDDQCGSGRCFLEPGCGDRRGRCCFDPHCGGADLEVTAGCRREGCLTYCGCDGQTFEGLPTRPYASTGPCR